MHEVLALQQILRDALIIHQIARRFPEGRVVQQRIGAVAGVEHQVVLFGGRDLQHLDARLVFQRVGLIGAQFASDIGVALLDQQAAGGRIRHVFNDDVFQLRLVARRGGIGIQHDRLMRLIDAHLERAAAGGVHFQPGVAEVAVFDVGQRRLAVDDRGDRRREDIQRHRRADVRRPAQLHGMFVDLLQLRVDVVRLPAEHVEDERRRFVHLDRAAVGEDHVVGGQRVAGGERRLRPQFHRQRFGRRIALPAFRQHRRHLGRIVAIRLHQPLI